VKDAGGHGSNARGGTAAHGTGVNQVGKPVTLSPQVLAYIHAHPEGFTVALNGSAPKSGYQVAIPGHQFTADIGGPHGDAALQKWAAEHSSALQAGGHVGGWKNPSGQFEIEPSHNIKSRAAAVAAGKARNQIAIRDLKGNKDIPTGGTGK
jgi:hypothetical protein